ncbi:amidohydrolase family protein [Nocardia fluminea]|uniref:Aminocarboxymuconate-semialdehyde decarboxylase n=1 Tax=Nocardia fluminea TaxID=134984 RepID=A0A2N3V5M2_9NOCA|nr:amidohydrolase family protein [Nocardia fluminea]PKV76891.1 aminocarboxymuconate-semialdehyde decarboxylase [Nocardia fluminea]
MTDQIVDVHAHALLPDVEAYVGELDPEGLAAAKDLDARRNGHESLAVSGRMIGERWQLLTDLPARLTAMDTAEVDLQLVSPSPSHYYPFLRPDDALEVAKRVNAAIGELVGRAPDRLLGLGVAPLQHPQQMVAALDDALGRGLRGVEIGSFGASASGGQANTVELSDPALNPFWAAAEKAGAVVFLHPFGCSVDERLNRFYLANTVSQPAENAIALSHLIFGGVLDRYPGLRVVAAHGGGYLPTIMGRSDHAWRVRPEAHGCRHLPSTYMRRLWFDSLTHDSDQLAELIRVAGPTRVLLGSDFPFDMGTDDPVAAVRAAGLPEEVVRAVLSGNAAALLPDIADRQDLLT